MRPKANLQPICKPVYTAAMEMHPDSLVIDRLGGPSVLARVFGIAPQSVSHWKRAGIPKARRMYLELSKPEVFAQLISTDGAPPVPTTTEEVRIAA